MIDRISQSVDFVGREHLKPLHDRTTERFTDMSRSRSPRDCLIEFSHDGEWLLLLREKALEAFEIEEMVFPRFLLAFNRQHPKCRELETNWR